MGPGPIAGRRRRLPRCTALREHAGRASAGLECQMKAKDSAVAGAGSQAAALSRTSTDVTEMPQTAVMAPSLEPITTPSVMVVKPPLVCLIDLVERVPRRAGLDLVTGDVEPDLVIRPTDILHRIG